MGEKFQSIAILRKKSKGIQDIDIDFIETFMFALNDEADQYESFLNKKIGKR